MCSFTHCFISSFLFSLVIAVVACISMPCRESSDFNFVRFVGFFLQSEDITILRLSVVTRFLRLLILNLLNCSSCVELFKTPSTSRNKIRSEWLANVEVSIRCCDIKGGFFKIGVKEIFMFPDFKYLAFGIKFSWGVAYIDGDDVADL